MPRWLCTATTDDGEPRVAIVTDTDGTNMPFGNARTEIADRMDCGALDAIIQLPDGDFRPDIYAGDSDDDEVPVTFVDL